MNLLPRSSLLVVTALLAAPPALASRSVSETPEVAPPLVSRGFHSRALEPRTPIEDEAPRPWNLNEALNTPDWLDISGEFRLRYEGISGQFRSSSRLDSSDHLFFARTLLKTKVDLEDSALVVEVMDSRHLGGHGGSQLNTSNVNVTDFLQAYAEFDFDTGDSDARSTLRVGRQTLDLGSRRLMARNRYRNTINAFTGADFEWQHDDTTVHAFFFLPTRRRPSDFPSVKDNDHEWDAEDDDFQFYGVHVDRELDERHRAEVYAFQIREDERGIRREYTTPGARLLRQPATSELDFEIESAVQFGRRRGSATARTQDHFAWFAHASVGYTFDATWKPRVRAAVDYASGDRSSTDNDSNRFDTLFGARRFEYGPTGILGMIARSNIISPELRLVLKPRDKHTWMWALRELWLASDEDAWTTSGVRDPTGDADRHVGTQIESRYRVDIPSRNLRLEGGALWFFDGPFQREAPGGQDRDTIYGYLQVRWRF